MAFLGKEGTLACSENCFLRKSFGEERCKAGFSIGAKDCRFNGRMLRDAIKDNYEADVKIEIGPLGVVFVSRGGVTAVMNDGTFTIIDSSNFQS
ncbi:MAG TPA: hypothetical protein VF185_00175 [Patescibacteria group bacterium]